MAERISSSDEGRFNMGCRLVGSIWGVSRRLMNHLVIIFVVVRYQWNAPLSIVIAVFIIDISDEKINSPCFHDLWTNHKVSHIYHGEV